MTEYDYSPGAYERQREKIHSISRWVDLQADEAPCYGNPFLPTETDGASITRSTSVPARAHHEPERRARARSPARSHSYSHDTSSRDSSRSRSRSTAKTSDASQPHSRASTPGSHTTHTSHTTHGHTSSRAYTRAPPARSHTYAAQYAAPTSVRTASLPVQYTSARGQPVIMRTPDKTYVVVPSSGARVEVRAPYKYGEAAERYPYTSPVSPSKKQPLLRQLLHLGSTQRSSSSSRRDDSTYTVYKQPSGTRRRTRSLSLY